MQSNMGQGGNIITESTVTGLLKNRDLLLWPLKDFFFFLKCGLYTPCKRISWAIDIITEIEAKLKSAFLRSPSGGITSV